MKMGTQIFKELSSIAGKRCLRYKGYRVPREVGLPANIAFGGQPKWQGIQFDVQFTGEIIDH